MTLSLDKAAARQRDYRSKNRDKVAARQRDYYSKNRDKAAREIAAARMGSACHGCGELMTKMPADKLCGSCRSEARSAVNA